MRTGARGSPWSPLSQLSEIHIFGLQAFRPLLHFKRYARTLFERSKAAARNGGKMDENIFATLWINPNPFAALNHFTVPVSFKTTPSAI